MRYFFLTYAILAVLVIGIGGFRGQHFSKPPIQVFPDMDNQDKLKAQAPSTFFADRQGGRLPVDETQPRGFNEEGALQIGGIPEYEFGRGIGYYYTGQVGDYYGTGMPEELALTTVSAAELIRLGEERFGIYCTACHGKTGNGLGITSRFGVPGIANFHLDPFKSPTYPDGRMFEVITHGKGQMGAYGTNIPVRDRWAIIAYVRTLQAAKDSAKQAAEQKSEVEAEQKPQEPAPAEDANEDAAPPASGTQSVPPTGQQRDGEAAPSVKPEPSVPPVTEDTPPTVPGAPRPGESIPPETLNEQNSGESAPSENEAEAQ